MGGIRAGTRLEQLLALRDRLNHEIAIERRHTLNAGRAAAQPARPAPTTPPAPTIERQLLDRGLTARQVKEWAVENGHVDHVARGRLSQRLLALYVQHHPTSSTDTSNRSTP